MASNTDTFDVSSIALTDPDGQAVPFSTFAGKPLVVQQIRFWG